MKRLVDSLKFCDPENEGRYTINGIFLTSGYVYSTDGAIAYRAKIPYEGPPVFVPYEKVRIATSGKSHKIEKMKMEDSSLILFCEGSPILLPISNPEKFPGQIFGFFGEDDYSAYFKLNIDDNKKILLALCESTNRIQVEVKDAEVRFYAKDSGVDCSFRVLSQGGCVGSSAVISSVLLLDSISSLSGLVDVFLSRLRMKLKSDEVEIVLATIYIT